MHKVVTRRIVLLEKSNLNMCKDVATEMELMQSQGENDFYEDVELQREHWHALNVLLDKHENVENLSHFNIKSIMTYAEIGESTIFKSTLVS